MRVKKKLLEIGRSYDWLADRVSDRTGMFCDSAYISRLITGKRKSERITQAITEILWGEQ